MLDMAVLHFPNLNPVALQLGPFALRWYALAYIVGLLLGWRYMVYLIRKEALWAPGKAPISVPAADDFLFWATLGVIVGGRTGYVLFYMLPGPISRANIAADPLLVFKIWEGGMAFHGGLVGVILATLWFCRQHKAPLFQVGDLVAACAPIGLFFGRIANFVNGELWGRESHLPWAMVFPTGGEIPRHPSQLYESFLEGVVLFVVLYLLTHRGGSLKKPGTNIGVFLILYGVFRALIELVREPDNQMPDALKGYVTMGMLLSLPMIAAGAWFIWRANKTAPQVQAAA